MRSKAKPRAAVRKGGRSTATRSKGPGVTATPALLAGGNLQIAKADGDAPVQVYIAAMPGWKRDLGRRLDVRNVPNVRKAVKWNSPFYGIDGQGWFLSFHVFTDDIFRTAADVVRRRLDRAANPSPRRGPSRSRRLAAVGTS